MKTAFIIVPALLAALAASTPLGLSTNHGGDFCASRYDGKYAMGCGSFLASCTSYLSIVMVCPKRTCFDDNTKKCMEKCMCKGVGTTEAPCETTTEPALEPSQVPSTELPQETTPTPCEPEPSDFCKERADGDYSIGCTSAYISCVDGKAIARECPSSLVLDEAANVCVARAYALSCNGKPTTTPLITTTETPKVETTEEPGKEPTEGCEVETTEAPELETTEEPGKEPTECATTSQPGMIDLCKDREDGYNNVGCTRFYIACHQGESIIMECQQDFVLDMECGRCIPLCLSKVCAGSPTTTETTEITTEAPKVETTEEPGKEPTACGTEPTEVDLCVHGDGFYSSAPSQWYLECINGRPTYHLCRTGFLFDTEKKMCVVIEKPTEVPEIETTEVCNVETTEAPEVETTEEPGKEPTECAATSQPGMIDFCKDREDGYISVGCTRFYIACQQGESIIMECQKDFVLDMECGRCIPLCLSKVCAGSPTTPETTTTTTEAPKVETTEETGKEPTKGCEVEKEVGSSL